MSNSHYALGDLNVIIHNGEVSNMDYKGVTYTGKDFMGLGWFGQCVLHLIDAGEKEELSVILDKMSNESLVTYITEKYDTRFSSEIYNIKALNAFFANLVYYAESRKSGVFREENGLLVILTLILSETESQITKFD